MNIDPQLVEEGIDTAKNTKPSSNQAFRSNLRLFPPPIFSRQGIAQSYNFKGNPASIVSTVVNEETGEEKKRLINRMRWKGYGPATIAFSDPIAPDKPPTNVEAVREQVDKNILKKLDELFAQRPVWTRASLFNQISATVAKEIHNSKVILPLVCYVFHDGPWRDTLVKLGYDPRKDPEGRFYQRLYFRNANHPINRPSVVTRRQERATTAATITTDPEKEEARTSHMFDGVNLTKETAAFQLCDITDVMLKEMIEDPDDVREACDERDGWYSTHALERIKAVLRLKFFSLLDGRPATDEECQAVLEQAEMESSKAVASSRNAKMRLGKHNMAKGALRPEEAAPLEKLNHLPNKRHIGKQDPYCAVTFDGQTRRTKAIKKGGQHPEWDEEIRFQLYEDDEELSQAEPTTSGTPPPLPPKSDQPSKIKGGMFMKVAAYADDAREPDLIGEGLVDLTEVITKGESDEWYTLTYKDRFAGKVYLEMTLYSNEPEPPKKKKTAILTNNVIRQQLQINFLNGIVHGFFPVISVRTY
ncbi:hypothetical protein HHX47_DHR5000101 [Lentinula edodes]|nr:hypothetical protein HHX47_DHR5000101 [Lentinula edodes]